MITEELESTVCRDQVFNRPRELIPEIISLIISSHRSDSLGAALIPPIIIIVAVGFIFRRKIQTRFCSLHLAACGYRAISGIVACLITVY